MIELKNVSKTFSTLSGSVEAVRDVSLRIGAGEIFGIIGLSGAGKSTLVQCMNLLQRPDTGTVTIDGCELTAVSPRELREKRRGIGMIFQHFNLMASRTVLQNVMFPLRGSGMARQQQRDRAFELLQLVGLPDKADAYPSQLSGGQKQRVAIARALAPNPRVLLCDEATSALDPQTTRSILQLLRDLGRRLGLTIVIITHEMAVVKEICGRVAVMQNGRIVEQGDVYAVFSHPREDITRELVGAATHLQQISELVQAGSAAVTPGPGQLLLRLTYSADNVSEALISTVSRRFGVDLSIVFGSIELVQGAPVGGLVILAGGERVQLEQAVHYLIDKNVGVEVVLDGKSFAKAGA